VLVEGRDLLVDDGVTTGNAYIDTIFDDEAATPIDLGAAPFTGRFRPQQPLSAFRSRDPNGTWTLEARDRVTGDLGRITDFSLTIQTETVASRLPAPIRDLQASNLAVLIDTLPEGEIVDQVEVEVAMTHPLAEGVALFLIAPDGTRIPLSTDNDGDQGSAEGTDVTFDDGAATPITDASAPFIGTFRPEQPLAALQGLDPNGIWRLQVVDDNTINPDVGPADEGSILDFGLTIATASVIWNGPVGNLMDQDADAVSFEALTGDEALIEFGQDAHAPPRPLSPDGTGPGQPFQVPFDPLTLPLIVPGPRIVGIEPEPVNDPASFVEGSPDQLVTNDRVASVLVTFGPGGDSVAALRPEATIGHFAELPGVVERLLGAG